MNWKWCGRKLSWPNLRYLRDETRETMKQPTRQDSQSLDQDMVKMFSDGNDSENDRVQYLHSFLFTVVLYGNELHI
jgi:hypothetical protein